MKANSFNRYFGLTTFGESHGVAYGIVFEDVLPGVKFPFEELDNALLKRKPAQLPHTSSREENDQYEVIAGVLDGITTGMPICVLFKNIDHKPHDYEALKDIFKPGHADFSWYHKFKIFDYRGSGRASGRETICRVAAGAYVKQILGDIKILSYPVSIGEFSTKNIDLSFIDKNPLSWCEKSTFNEVTSYLKSIKAEQESVGAVIEIQILNVPIGLGDPVFDKLDALLAKALLSIGSVKGIEFGEGFGLAYMKGSKSNDVSQNYTGGIDGGVSNGKVIKMRVVIKPVPSIQKPQQAFDNDLNKVTVTIKGRHDVCLVPRILPVIESMIQLVLADAIAHQNLISNKKSDLNACREAIDKIDEDILLALYRRFEIVKSIGDYKSINNLTTTDIDRENTIYDRLCTISNDLGLSFGFIRQLWTLIINESKKLQQPKS
ncbi:MAG: chorismate synthase [Candidatus Cloacimonetes bacterium]|nr:chorismate synthase [Candidatus Cloacimonadota bacterium]